MPPQPGLPRGSSEATALLKRVALSQGAGPAQPLEPHAESERRRLDRLHVLVRVADAIALAPRLLHAARLLELAALCVLLGV